MADGENDVGRTPTLTLARWAPVYAVGAVCLVNAWLDRGSLRDVPFFNDATMHEQMVRVAAYDIAHFHWPFTQWYPLLNLGSPQFLHYQGLGATLLGALGTFISPGGLFRVSLWALVAFWPVAIYASARIFGFERGPAAAAALASSFISSSPHIGYEPRAYQWFGYGVWAQLCASWALPFAWAWTWRALEEARHAWKAAVLIALTAALHYETGYAAFAAVIILPWIVPSAWRERGRRALCVLGGSLAGVAWIVVPLLLSAKWAAINSGQANSPLARGYGARMNLSWLVHGHYFDEGRLPVLTAAVSVGVASAIWQWRRDSRARAVLVLTVAIFLVSFGPTTWGALVDAVPGHADIFFRRFLGPTQLGALFIIAVGAAQVGEVVSRLGANWAERRWRRPVAAAALAGLAATVWGVAVAGAALPAEASYQNRNTYSVDFQLSHQAPVQGAIAPIISYLRTVRDGRVYAGTPYNWGHDFRIGIGPVYLYLADNDIDQVSTSGWAASLMEEPGALFDEKNLSDYQIFGIRYILTPSTMQPPIAATPLITSGPYRLWEVPSAGYFSIVKVEGSVDENKATIARQAGLVLRTEYFQEHVDLAVNYGTPLRAFTYPAYRPAQAIGRVLAERVDLKDGVASARVEMATDGNLVLSASFDPGWQASVDGRLVPTQMVAPALVSVAVPAGIHDVAFRYQGFRWYLPLILGGALAIGALAYLTRPSGQRRRASRG